MTVHINFIYEQSSLEKFPVDDFSNVFIFRTPGLLQSDCTKLIYNIAVPYNWFMYRSSLYQYYLTVSLKQQHLYHNNYYSA